MQIGSILKDAQPDEYSKLRKKKRKKHSKKPKDKFTERDIMELMSHSSYKRHGGAIRQVR